MATERVTKAGIYVRLGGAAESVTKAGMYVRISNAVARVTEAGMYIRIEPNNAPAPSDTIFVQCM